MADRVDEKPVSEWTSLEYKRLSGMLNRETDILLSETTLKRIFGRLKTSQRYFPQKATRDALARFIGFRDWQEFELVYQAQRQNRQQTPANVVPAPVIEELLILPAESVVAGVSPALRRRPRKWAVIAILAGLVCVAAIFLLINFLGRDGFDKVKHLRLQCLNPIGGVPHSALFKLEGSSSLPPEAAELEVSWGEGKRDKPFQKSYVANHLYQWPGVQYAILSWNGRPIDTVTVQMRTNGWVANAINDLDAVRVFPVHNLEPLHPANLSVSITDLAKAGLDTLDSFIIGYSNIKPSNIDGDNCEMKARVFAGEVRPGVRCPHVLLLLQGERNNHYVRIAMPNCAAFTNYKFSEQEADGEWVDLRHLSIDLRGGADVGVKVQGRHAALSVNGKQLLEVNYKQPVGKILGFKFAVNGIGRVENPTLTDLRTGEQY